MPSTGNASAKPPDVKQPSVDSRKQSMNLRPPIEALNCPRCDSPNTKFCYYNNYSLTQPRYFCKTCRRYWTKGGALRNVPVGGGCRKKKTKLASAPSLLVGHFSGLDSPNAGGFSQLCSFGGFQYTPATSLCSALDASAAYTASLEVFNHSLPTAPIQELSSGVGGRIQDSMASSIESLRSMNQELHWKLQQQRLAMFSSASNSLIENHPQQKQSISFQTDVKANELVLENSYGVIDGSSDSAINGWNDMQTWNDPHQYYTALR